MKKLLAVPLPAGYEVVGRDKRTGKIWSHPLVAITFEDEAIVETELYSGDVEEEHEVSAKVWALHTDPYYGVYCAADEVGEDEPGTNPNEIIGYKNPSFSTIEQFVDYMKAGDE